MSGPLPEKEVRNAILRLMGTVVAAEDQARTMTDVELGNLLLSGRWTTIEIHEAGRRLIKHASTPVGGEE